jgi:hypothetical protein
LADRFGCRRLVLLGLVGYAATVAALAAFKLTGRGEVVVSPLVYSGGGFDDPGRRQRRRLRQRPAPHTDAFSAPAVWRCLRLG